MMQLEKTNPKLSKPDRNTAGGPLHTFIVFRFFSPSLDGQLGSLAPTMGPSELRYVWSIPNLKSFPSTELKMCVQKPPRWRVLKGALLPFPGRSDVVTWAESKKLKLAKNLFFSDME